MVRAVQISAGVTVRAGILVAELAVLATLVIMFGTTPPLAYELGYGAAGSFLVMQVYSIRRRVRALRHIGPLERWLDAHVFFGCQGALFAAYHCVGIRPALDVATLAAVLVSLLVLTGVVGRYVLRTHAIWAMLHRPLAFLMLALTSLHVIAHFAYAR